MKEDFDFVVIGAGSAGSTAAATLVKCYIVGHLMETQMFSGRFLSSGVALVFGESVAANGLDAHWASTGQNLPSEELVSSSMLTP